jgi:hypothetical protein
MAARAAGKSRHSPTSIKDAGCGIKSPAHQGCALATGIAATNAAERQTAAVGASAE